jgi:hypothetical protein
MPTTELLAHSVLRIFYTTQGQQHRINLRCNLVDGYVIGEDPVLEAFTGSGHNHLSTVVVGYFATHMIAMMIPSGSVDRYEVWDVRYNPPILVYGQNLSGYAGTISGTPANPVAMELTLTYRDTFSKIVHHQFLGAVAPDVAKGSSTTGKNWDAMNLGFLSKASDTLGDFIVGRSNHQHSSLLSWRTQSNNALERKVLRE